MLMSPGKQAKNKDKIIISVSDRQKQDEPKTPRERI